MSRLMRHVLLLAGLYTLAVLFLGFAAGRASAQDGRRGVGHAEHHDVYRSLVNPTTRQGCCHALTPDDSSGDCRPGAVWRDADGALRARIGGREMAVPESALVPGAMNPHPPVGMICEKNGRFYCVAMSGAGG